MIYILSIKYKISYHYLLLKQSINCQIQANSRVMDSHRKYSDEDGLQDKTEKLQINASNTNMKNMLVFYDSDEDQSKSKKKASTNRMRGTYQKQKQRQLKGRIQASQLKPSLMNNIQSDSDYYEPIATKPTKQSSKQQKQNILQIQQTQETVVNKQSQNISNIQKQEQNKLDRNQQDQIIFHQIKSFPQEPAHKQQSIGKQNNLIIDFNEEMTQEYIYKDKQDQKSFDILALDQKVRERSLYFQQIVNNQKNHQNIVNLMLSPILKQTKQIFQVYVSSGFIGKNFEFAMETGISLKLLMKAQRSIGINKTCYRIQSYFQDTKQFEYICTLESDTDRRQYNILKQSKKGKSQLLGTIINRVTVKSDRYLILYYPTINSQNNKPQVFYYNPLHNLYHLHQDQQKKNVDFIITTKFTEEQKQQCMKDYGLRKSAKSMEFKGENGDLKLVIGKKQSKRYSLIVGPGINPIQIFCMAIVNIQI